MMAWNDALEKHRRELEQELLRRVRELQRGEAPASGPQVPMAPTQTWKAFCDAGGWSVGGDSAHRVARRNAPELHASVPHRCVYDGRAYP